MTSPEHRPLGPSTPTAEGPAPFSISAPTELTLAADRSGTTTFTVSNLTGRPVRVRLLPKGIGATDQSWLAVVGEAERPLAVAGTLSADVKVTVPPTTPAGAYTARLDVAAEDATETVTGQTVSFTVPEPEKKKGAPVWLFLVIALVVLALIAGGVYWFFLRSDKPSNETAPAISVTTAAVGKNATATKGTWKGAAATTLQWQSCSSPSACADIAGQTSTTYTMTAADVGKSIRVTEKAFAVDPATDSSKAADSEADASSQLVGPVLQPNVTIPSVVGVPASQATKTLVDTGLLPVSVPSGVQGNSCDPIVVGQSPSGGAAPAGSPVGISMPTRPSNCFAIAIDPSWSTKFTKELGGLSKQ